MPFSGKDETVTCRDCKQPFVFSVKDQKFYESKGFADAPKRCKQCRDAKKALEQEREAIAAPPPPAENDDNYGNARQQRRRRRGDE